MYTITETQKNELIAAIAERVTYKTSFDKIVKMIENGNIIDAIEQATMGETYPRIQCTKYNKIIGRG